MANTLAQAQFRDGNGRLIDPQALKGPAQTVGTLEELKATKAALAELQQKYSALLVEAEALRAGQTTKPAPANKKPVDKPAA